MNVLSPTDDNWDDDWVTRLAKGHFIYLCKEKTFAKVVMPYFPPDRPFYTAGEIAIQKMTGPPMIWLVKPNGSGLDNNPLIAPVEGNLLDKPFVRYSELETKIAELEVRLANVERDYLRAALSRSYSTEETQ